MIRATTILPAGTWTGTPADTVLLDFDARHRRRLAMSARGGMSFLLDLPAAIGLRHGDGLLLEDGRIIAVEAAAEPLVDISANSLPQLIRIAWHLGNRQLPTQLMGDHLRIRRDHVVEAMLVGLGAAITLVDAPFEPESDGDKPAGPGAGFAQGHAFSEGQGFAYSQGSSRNRSFSRGFSQGAGPAFSEAHGHAHANSHSNQSHTEAQSHAHSPGRDHQDHAEAHDDGGGGPQPR